MKYLAILKDAIYETIDFKIFYILMGVSVLLALCGLCFNFPHKPVEKVLGKLTGGSFAVSDVQALDESRFNSVVRYRFTLTRTSLGLLPSFLTMQKKSEEKEGDVRNRRGGPRQFQFGEFGIRDVKLVETIQGTDNAPEQVKVEATINWAELPFGHRFVASGAVDQEMAWPLGMVATAIQGTIIDFVGGWIGLIIAVIISAGFVPNMLRKGTIDLLLVKPVSRPAAAHLQVSGRTDFRLLERCGSSHDELGRSWDHHGGLVGLLPGLHSRPDRVFCCAVFVFRAGGCDDPQPARLHSGYDDVLAVYLGGEQLLYYRTQSPDGDEVLG